MPEKLFFQMMKGEYWEFLLIPWGLSFQLTIIIFGAVILHKLKMSHKTDIPLNKWWHVIVAALPAILISIWVVQSGAQAIEDRRVDETYYFHAEADTDIFHDNRGRTLHAKRFGDYNEGKLIRKRVFRGHYLLIGWEWVEFDLVDKEEA